jgi:hypothetical protein
MRLADEELIGQSMWGMDVVIVMMGNWEYLLFIVPFPYFQSVE